jgi:hypothetical protein
MTLSLENFQLEAAAGERGGELIYRVKLYAYRNDEWTICGVIDLTAEEYPVFRAALQAHEITFKS